MTEEVGLDPTAGGREPWPPSRTDWGAVKPLPPETIKAIGQRARYWVTLWPSLSAPAARRAFHELADLVLLLVEDAEGYDIVELPGQIPLGHPDGGHRAD